MRDMVHMKCHFCCTIDDFCGAASISSVALEYGATCVSVCAQVIKAISGKGAPACNCVALTGMTGEAKMFRAPREPKA